MKALALRPLPSGTNVLVVIEGYDTVFAYPLGCAVYWDGAQLSRSTLGVPSEDAFLVGLVVQEPDASSSILAVVVTGRMPPEWGAAFEL